MQTLSVERFSHWHPIGRGGSAEVFRVHDNELGIDLAIKLLNPDRVGSTRDQRAMRNEVLVSRALRHPFICPIHDVYDGPHGFGIVMDLLQGCDLKTWQRDNRQRLNETFEQRLKLLEHVSDALRIAHERIVHRDLKPANIFLKDGDIGRPLILDFGLTVLDRNDGASRRGGTPRYMAPEQRRGLADARSDLFSLGVLAYELLTNGQHPFAASAGKLRDFEDWRDETVTPPSRHCALIAPALDRLILSAIRIDPDRRPADAAEFQAGLVSAAGEGQQVRQASSALDIETVTVPAGTYAVGSPSSSRFPAEKPMRHLQLAGFRIARFPVSNRQYAEFASQTGRTMPTLSREPGFDGDEQPVVGLSLAEAREFAAWYGARLPSELEWEVAAKAGEPLRRYPWGDEAPTARHLNFDSQIGTTTPVSAYPSGCNPWGLWDLAGNTWEWCDDRWQDDLLRQLEEGAAFRHQPAGPDEDAAIRGGGLDDLPDMCRCAFRQQEHAAARRCDLGFRIAFDLDGED